jgi:tetratricopeptide (TPR) repeat protein
MPNVLYASSTLTAVAVPADQALDRIVITFVPRTNGQSLKGPGFAADFLKSNGVSAVHVLCSGNDWFQYPDMDDCLAAIASYTAQFSFRITYGSSMGAYGALICSRALRADRVIAISPQFSIDRLKVPFERRWRAPAAAIAFLRDDMATGLAADAEVACIFDPRNRDRVHVKLLENLGAVWRFAAPYSGHPTGRFLVQTRSLSTLVRRLLNPAPLQQQDLAEFRRTVRERRRASPIYWANLSELLARREKTDAAIACLEQAIGLNPVETVYHERLGALLIKTGEYRRAYEHLRIGIRRRPDRGVLVRNMAIAEAKIGRRREGLARLDSYLDTRFDALLLQTRNRIATRIKAPLRQAPDVGTSGREDPSSSERGRRKVAQAAAVETMDSQT